MAFYKNEYSKENWQTKIKVQQRNEVITLEVKLQSNLNGVQKKLLTVEYIHCHCLKDSKDKKSGEISEDEIINIHDEDDYNEKEDHIP